MTKNIIFISFLICILHAKVPEFELKNAADKGLKYPAVGLGTGGYGFDSSVGYK